MARHMRMDADAGVTTMDAAGDQQYAPADTTFRLFDGSDPVDRPAPAPVADDREARRRFGGMNLGACFFGWLVAVATAALLAGVVGAALGVADATVGVAQSDAEQRTGTIAVAAGVVVLVVLLVGYYAGGYVGGRMSRFDGARQGLGVWAIGLVVTLVTAGAGAILGTRYDVSDRVDLSRISLSTEQMGWGAGLAGVALLLGTLVAATLGGVIGRHYHDRVDRLVHGR